LDEINHGTHWIKLIQLDDSIDRTELNWNRLEAIDSDASSRRRWGGKIDWMKINRIVIWKNQLDEINHGID
jgi:hypothetical protein